MSVSVHVSNIDREAKSLVIEAFDSKNRRIFKSPMKYKLETRKHVESVLRKELKVFDKPIWGGLSHCLPLPNRATKGGEGMISTPQPLPQRFIQTELGTEKYCKGCDDYYPADQEFFFGTGMIKKDGTPCLETLCKACYKEKYKRSTQRSNDVSHRYGVTVNG